MDLGDIATMFYFGVNELRCCGTRCFITEHNMPKSVADLGKGPGAQKDK